MVSGISRLAAVATALSLGSSAVTAKPVVSVDSNGVQLGIGFDPNAVSIMSVESTAEHIEYSLEDLAAMGTGVALPSNQTLEELAERAIVGNDDRVEWTDSSFPYSAIGRVQWSNGVYCSGTLVGPRHVITARHCTPTEGQAVSLRFSPFYFDGETVYGGSQVVSYIYPPTQEGECVYKEDWAIHILEDRLGDSQGYFGARTVDSSYLNRNIFYNFGYPGDKGGVLPYRSEGSTINRIDTCGSDGPSWTDTDTAGGQSGGPLWEYAGTGDRFLMGTLYGSTDTEAVFASGQNLVNAVLSARESYP